MDWYYSALLGIVLALWIGWIKRVQAVRAALAEPVADEPVAERGEYPPLPEPYCREFRDPKERYTADQMRAYVDADRAQQLKLPPDLSLEQLDEKLAAWLHLNLYGYVDARPRDWGQAMSDTELLALMASGAVLLWEDDNGGAELVTRHGTVTAQQWDRLARQGWLTSFASGTGARLSDDGRAAHIKSMDELGDGRLAQPEAKP